MNKPVSAATRELLAEMRTDEAPSEDSLKAIRAKVAELRELEFERTRLVDLAKETAQNIMHLKEKLLPDMMDEAGVSNVGIAAQGNLPPYDVRIRDRFHANIPDEGEAEAYEYLRKTKNDDLIKTTFTISFGLKESKQTATFQKLLDKAGVLYSVKQGVPWNTLTAWFKAEHRRKPLPPKAMAVLGATVGRVAEVVKAKKERT